MIRRLREVGQVLTQAALAPWCPACGRPQGRHGAGVCLRCWDEVDEDRFGPEQADAVGTAGVWAVGPYRGRLRRVVRCLKFSGLPGLARPLGERLAATLDGRAGEVDLVVPVPLHWRRAWRRGYNQADLLARTVARGTGLPLEPGALRRTRRTDPQRGRTREQRARNVSGAFEARPSRFAGARVLLVDDVVTTGATVGECARVLVDSGARAVCVAAVARTMPRSDSEGATT